MRLSSLLASLAIVAAVLLLTLPVMASDYLFSGSGSGFICTPAAPCTFSEALSEAATAPSLQIGCADSTANQFGVTITRSVTINCAGTNGSIGSITIASGAIVVLRNLRVDLNSVIITLQSGTLIMENVQISSAFQNAILAQPNTPSTLILKNCLIDTGDGVLLQPQAGGSISATFDHVTISKLTGGGIRADSSNGPISVDIVDSVISDNASNGLNISTGSGTQTDVVNITRSTIARNGLVGIQTGGNNAAVLLNASTLDSNTNGATLILNGSRILSYGNNQIIGGAGAGFTKTISLQ